MASTCHTVSGLSIPNEYPWANLFQLLDVHGVSWKYYLATGDEPDCDDDEMTCDPQIQTHGIGSFWNPVPLFGWVQAQSPAYLALHNPDADQFVLDAKNGTLPQISWVVPANVYSEHAPNRITTGMEYVTSLVNAVMSSPEWNSSAIFISWDEWGGFYDHVVPPNVDMNGGQYPIQGFGIRVPGLMISPYAKAGMIDHSILSFDSYATFFEDLFLGGARLNPTQLGNPDSRPDIRDALRRVKLIDGSTAPLGKLMDEFDFSQPPIQPMLLSTHIPTGLTAGCDVKKKDTVKCTTSLVTLTWDNLAMPPATGPFTYHVTRDNHHLAQCVTMALACTDTPGPGRHLYRAFSVDAAGAVSPLSAAIAIIGL
jgi:phospholipase C